jgi:hypothetical protein
MVVMGAEFDRPVARGNAIIRTAVCGQIIPKRLRTRKNLKAQILLRIVRVILALIQAWRESTTDRMTGNSLKCRPVVRRQMKHASG